MVGSKRTPTRKPAKKSSGTPAPASPSAAAAPPTNFAASASFSFSSPPPAGRPLATASTSGTIPTVTPNGASAGNGAAGRETVAASSDEDEDDSSDEEDDDDDDDSDPEEVGAEPVERADDELSDEEKVIRADAKKEEGNVYFKAKNYASATRLYSAAISLVPTNPAYLTNRAASLMASRIYSQALADCVAASALQIAAPQSKTLLRLAKCQLELGLIPAAQQTLDQILVLDPSNAQLPNERRRAARMKNHVDNVCRERSSPDKNWTMILLGIDAAAKELEVTPREWRAWKVEALIGKKRYDEALGQASDLLRADPKQPDALYFRGLCFYFSGNHAQAIAHSQEALRSDPDYTLARTLLRKVRKLDEIKDAGNDAFKSNRLQEAIDKYTEGIQVDLDNDSIRAMLLSNRATAYLKFKKYTEALADCDACLAVSAEYFKALRTRGRIHLALEEWESAIRDFKAAYELAPTGSVDESGLAKEVKDAEAKFKKSKMKDHYKTLGIQSDATEDEIKKGYRRSSLIHHPDKGGTDEKFKEVGEAYAILSDPARRSKFDAGIDESEPGGGMQSDFGGMNMEDLFSHGGFGGGFGGGGGGGFHSHGGGRNNPFGY